MIFTVNKCPPVKLIVTQFLRGKTFPCRKKVLVNFPTLIPAARLRLVLPLSITSPVYSDFVNFRPTELKEKTFLNKRVDAGLHSERNTHSFVPGRKRSRSLFTGLPPIHHVHGHCALCWPLVPYFSLCVIILIMNEKHPVGHVL